MAGAELGGMPVSAPGAMSTRTDRQPVRDLPNAAWGENKDFTAIEGGAPMAATPKAPPPTGLFTPTDRRNEPISSGAPFGAGPGPEVLARPESSGLVPATTLTSTLQKLASVQPNDERLAGLLALVQKNGW